MNGKGDSPRPVDRERYESNYDEIQWNDGRTSDCESCEVGCRNFQKTGLVCFPVSKQQEPEQVRLCDKGKSKAQGPGK